MYLIKLASLIIGSMLGQQAIVAQTDDYVAIREKDACWKRICSPKQQAVYIRFQAPNNLKLANEGLNALQGQLECRMHITLHKDKITMVRLLWNSNKKPEKPLSALQRRTLKTVFKNMNFVLNGEAPKSIKRYKTTWVCRLEDGVLQTI